MQARGTKQRKLVQDTLRELQWIESASLVQDFWSAVECSGIPEFLGRLKARGQGKMGSDILLVKMENKKISVYYQVGCNGSDNGRWNCVKDGSRKRVQHVM